MHVALLFDCVDIIIGFAYIINNTVILLFIFLSKEINFIPFSLVIISLLHFFGILFGLWHPCKHMHANKYNF
jgi:hypothetical protein